LIRTSVLRFDGLASKRAVLSTIAPAPPDVAAVHAVVATPGTVRRTIANVEDAAFAALVMQQRICGLDAAAGDLPTTVEAPV